MNSIYQEKVVDQNIILDDKQKMTMLTLANLWRRHAQNRRWYQKIKNTTDTLHGFYLYGPPGTGKSTLLKLIYESIDIPQKHKRYSHTTQFISEMHMQLSQSEGPAILETIIKQLSEYRAIFFDEFQILDIASSNIIRRILLRLFQNNVMLGFTSNYAPTELYPNGLQRSKFLELIRHITQHCIVHKLDNGIDYRSLTSGNLINLIYSNNTSDSKTALLSIFNTLCHNKNAKIVPGKVISQGRIITIEFAYRHIACMDFFALCGANLASYDYRSIAKKYKYILIYGIRKDYFEDINVCRRFIAMIDEFYEANIILKTGFLFDWQQLLQLNKRHAPDMQRTTSRLQEMLRMVQNV